MKKREIFFLWLFLLGLTGWRLWYIQILNLAEDEAYYWVWSKHLSLGYYDHPPLVAWLIFLTSYLGKGEFFVRLSSPLLALGLSLILLKLYKEIYSSTSPYPSIFFNLTPLFSVGSVLITPDVPLIFFWTLTLYALWKARENGKWWYIAGIMAGLTFLSKYTAILLLPPLFLFFLLTPGLKKWFLKKEPYLGALLGFFLASPNLWWNFKKKWVSFLFQLHHATGGKFSLLKGGKFFLGQAGVISPLLFLFFLGIIFSSGKNFWKERRDEDGFIFFFSLIPFLFFTFSGFKGTSETNWVAPSYIPLFVGGAWLLERKKTKVVKLSLILTSFGLTFLLHLHSLHPLLPLSPSKDPTARVWGWKNLAEEVEEKTKEKEGVFLIVDNYRIASELDFYLKRKVPLFVLPGKGRHQYGLWRNPYPLPKEGFYLTQRENPKRVNFILEDLKKVKVINIKRKEGDLREFSLWGGKLKTNVRIHPFFIYGKRCANPEPG